MELITIRMPSSLLEIIDALVQVGLYSNRSEAIRSLIVLGLQSLGLTEKHWKEALTKYLLELLDEWYKQEKERLVKLVESLGSDKKDGGAEK